MRTGEELFPPPLIVPEGHLLPREKVIFLLREKMDSATPGKPFVKNDIKVRDEPLTMDVIVQGKAYVLNETRVRGEY